MSTATDFDYDLGQEKPVLTYAQWMNGKKILKQLGGIAFTGGVLMEADQFPPKTTIPGFTPQTVVLNGNEKEVFGSSNAEFAVIARRRRYFTETPEGKRYFGISEYEAVKAQGINLRGHCQVAVVFKGQPDQVIYLTFTGTADRAFTADLKRFTTDALPLTTRKTDGVARSMPLNAFWVTLTPLPHETVGDTKKSEATNPSLNLPKEFTREGLLAQYVGRDILPSLNALVEQHKEWAAAWSFPTPATPTETDPGTESLSATTAE